MSANCVRVGMLMVEPDEGLLACGAVGPGRLAEPERIAEAVIAAGKLTAGVTSLGRQSLSRPDRLEPLDPVRYISNRSSGKMGYASAEAAAARGARVSSSGPVTLPDPAGVR